MNGFERGLGEGKGNSRVESGRVGGGEAGGR
jgi:hypothetical protein